MEESLPKNHEDHIAGKTQREKKESPAWNLDKVHSKKELIVEAQREKKEVASVESG